MQWLWITDPCGDTPHDGKRKNKRRQLRTQRCVVLLCTFSLFHSFCWLVYLAPKRPPHAFRASDPFTTWNDTLEFRRKHEEDMLKFLKKRPNACGLAAPNIHVYQHVFLTTSDKQWHFNAKWAPASNEVKTMREASYMCGKNAKKHEVERYPEINLVYYDKDWVFRKETLTGNKAYCAQHFVDILDGKWPCNGTAEFDHVRNPVVPKKIL